MTVIISYYRNSKRKLIMLVKNNFNFCGKLKSKNNVTCQGQLKVKVS